MKKQYSLAIVFITVSLFGMAGSITGALPAMLAALFYNPKALVKPSTSKVYKAPNGTTYPVNPNGTVTVPLPGHPGKTTTITPFVPPGG